MNSFYLGAKHASAVQPPGHLDVIYMEAALSDGRLQAIFELGVPATGPQLASPSNVLYAAGPLSPSGGLEEHDYVSHI